MESNNTSLRSSKTNRTFNLVNKPSLFSVVGRSLVAKAVLEELMIEYKRRKWYAEALRIYKMQVKRRTAWYGIVAEQTVIHLCCAVEPYGRLERKHKVCAVLADMQKVYELGNDE